MQRKAVRVEDKSRAVHLQLYTGNLLSLHPIKRADFGEQLESNLRCATALHCNETLAKQPFPFM